MSEAFNVLLIAIFVQGDPLHVFTILGEADETTIGRGDNKVSKQKS